MERAGGDLTPWLRAVRMARALLQATHPRGSPGILRRIVQARFERRPKRRWTGKSLAFLPDQAGASRMIWSAGSPSMC
jgi:hypothetical protein